MPFLRNRFRCWLPALVAVLLAACAPHPAWQLDDVRGHLPDLKFQMINDLDQPVTAADYRGKVVLMYFGYTHCPDVCPLTLVHLHTVMQSLGKAADDGKGPQGSQMLVDRNGWLRARAAPGQGGWSEDDLVCRASVSANSMLTRPAASAQPGADGLEVLIRRMDAERVRPRRGGFPH